MKKPLPVSVIVTVRHEEKTIEQLLSALCKQTVLPAEVVIVDAASADATVEKIKAFAEQSSFPIVVDIKKGNRSTGRNRAITLATNELIAVTDAGCLPHAVWLEQLLKAYQPGSVVAGYAIGKPKTPFQAAVVPYFLVMPDRVNPAEYLPATRSMLMEKKAWQKVGGFREELNTSEDFVFATELKKNFPIIFAKEAAVDWFPLNSVWAFFKQILTFAACDIRAGILRPKIIALYGRYILAILFAVLLWQLTSPRTMAALLVFATALYLAWAVKKNYRYAKSGWYWLPILQLVADAAVMIGTGWGAVQRLLGLGK